MFRRFVPSLAVAALVLAGCGGAGPALSDPREIITQGLEATGDLKSFHMAIALDGSVTVPEMGGGGFQLNGTTLEGDFDLETQAAQLTLSMPAMLGLTGEFILVDETFYMKTSMTGEQWSKMEAPMGEEVPTDPQEALGQLGEFLDTEGVETEKLDDVECGDTTCYVVRMTIPASAMGEAGEQLDGDVSEVIGDELVLDLRFDRQNLWLAGMSTSVESAGSTFDVDVSLSEFNDPVEVTAPPADQVTDELPVFPM